MRKEDSQAQTWTTPDPISDTVPDTLPEVTRAREQLMRELHEAQADVIRLLDSMAAVQDWQPEPAEWSFRFIAAHLATVEEECHLVRVRQIAAGDTPDIPNYRDRGIDFSTAELHDSLQKWQANRRALLDFIAELPPRTLTYIGLHEKLGPVSLLDTLQEMLDQDQGHLRHIRRLIVAWHEDHPHAPPNLSTRTGQTENGIAPLYTNHKHGAS